MNNLRMLPGCQLVEDLEVAAAATRLSAAAGEALAAATVLAATGTVLPAGRSAAAGD
jgi:hypothetical protein